MGNLYRKDLDRYKIHFNEYARTLGIDVSYRYIIKRNKEKQSLETVYSELSEPIIQSVVIENGIPQVESLKQLGWFVDTEKEQILVDFSTSTPNLQEGCRFTITSNENEDQNKEYIVIKLSSEVLFPTHIKCLCEPILENESTYNKKDGNITYGQQSIYSDEENNTFINSEKELTFF